MFRSKLFWCLGGIMLVFGIADAIRRPLFSLKTGETTAQATATGEEAFHNSAISAARRFSTSILFDPAHVSFAEDRFMVLQIPEYPEKYFVYGTLESRNVHGETLRQDFYVHLTLLCPATSLVSRDRNQECWEAEYITVGGQTHFPKISAWKYWRPSQYPRASTPPFSPPARPRPPCHAGAPPAFPGGSGAFWA
jgi:hypothetical protein